MGTSNIVLTFLPESETSEGVLNTKGVPTDENGTTTVLLINDPNEGTKTYNTNEMTTIPFYRKRKDI
jgi:hypothetical protein